MPARLLPVARPVAAAAELIADAPAPIVLAPLRPVADDVGIGVGTVMFDGARIIVAALAAVLLAVAALGFATNVRRASTARKRRSLQRLRTTGGATRSHREPAVTVARATTSSPSSADPSRRDRLT